MHPQLPLVVVGAAGPNAAVLDDGLERVGPPLGTRVDGHDVVMAVDQNGFGLGVDDFLGVHHRIAVGRHHLGPVGTRLDQSRGEPLGATLHVGLVLGLRADRRDTQQVEQLADETLLIGVYIMLYFIHVYKLHMVLISPMKRWASASASAIVRASV